ncbi:MAG: 2OG-Fe(II) oxygenase [Rhodobiaceae bacterium]|nr:2OG-Fe(II) oxygenase [Rhodobiaceae bacterium]MCC0018168.1 2OG-Fe(II) oxygenase [Rhodobiaceae bacterium]MCC0051266.1 2OG-Fe(II) oxygenase [Rhodobiaceae bacterium]MCC0053095.1 2OG-Fe(II) oxygenase [Rhodobiaceae bacterium]
MSDAALVEVEITLTGGRSFQGALPCDSPILASLFTSLAASHDPDPNAPVTLLQFPLEGGNAACSFMSTSLVSVVTRPPVLINPQQPATHALPVETPASFASHVVIEDFLTPDENRQVLEYALENEAHFEGSGVLTHEGQSKDETSRRSRVLFAIHGSKWNDVFLQRLKLHLSHIAPALGLDAMRLVPKEIQLTASNDGDFFKAHVDSGNVNDDVVKRVLTFVYYLHKTPRPFSGGDLLVYTGYPNTDPSQQSMATIAVPPRNNTLVAFVSNTTHEVDVVRCPSGEFGDSRFTVNGWMQYA